MVSHCNSPLRFRFPCQIRAKNPFHRHHPQEPSRRSALRYTPDLIRLACGETDEHGWSSKARNRTKIALGHYPSLSLQDARRKALAALAAPEEKSPPPTFPEAREAFLAKHGPALRPRSLYQLTRNLQRHFSWKTTLDQITHYDVATALEAIAAPKPSRPRPEGHPYFFQLVRPPLSPLVSLCRSQEADPTAPGSNTQ